MDSAKRWNPRLSPNQRSFQRHFPPYPWLLLKHLQPPRRRFFVAVWLQNNLGAVFWQKDWVKTHENNMFQSNWIMSNFVKFSSVDHLTHVWNHHFWLFSWDNSKVRNGKTLRVNFARTCNVMLVWRGIDSCRWCVLVYIVPGLTIETLSPANKVRICNHPSSTYFG